MSAGGMLALEPEPEPDKPQTRSLKPAGTPPPTPSQRVVAVGLNETPSCILHVRGCAGKFEDEHALTEEFSRFGTVVQATVRHRIDKETGANTSWALVTMSHYKGATRALKRSSELTAPLTVTSFSQKQADNSKGAMGSVRREAAAKQIQSRWRQRQSWYETMLMTMMDEADDAPLPAPATRGGPPPPPGALPPPPPTPAPGTRSRQASLPLSDIAEAAAMLAAKAAAKADAGSALVQELSKGKELKKVSKMELMMDKKKKAAETQMSALEHAQYKKMEMEAKKHDAAATATATAVAAPEADAVSVMRPKSSMAETLSQKRAAGAEGGSEGSKKKAEMQRRVAKKKLEKHLQGQVTKTAAAAPFAAPVVVRSAVPPPSTAPIAGARAKPSSKSAGPSVAYTKEELQHMPPMKLKALAKQLGVPTVPRGQPARSSEDNVAAILARAPPPPAADPKGGAVQLTSALFDLVDDDRSGYLEVNEGKQFLALQGCAPSELDYYWKDLLRSADVNQDG
jgi:hypothetical protein